MTHRYAALDIGSNSVHMIIVEVSESGAFRTLDREREMLKLGAGTFAGRRIRDERVAETRAVMQQFVALTKRWDVDEVLAVATSAVREAENGQSLLDAIYDDTGLRIRLIEGDDEARLIWKGVSQAIDLRKRRALVIDVGGGSVELILGDAERVYTIDSLPLGVQRLRDFYAKDDPLPSAAREELLRHIGLVAGPAAGRIGRVGFDVAIVTSGTLLSLGLAAIRARGLDPWTALDGQVISTRELRDLAAQLLAMDEKERLRVPGIDERRADTAHLAAALAVALLDRLGVNEVQLSTATLREGLVVERLAEDGITPHPDVRRQSVMTLVERLRPDRGRSGRAHVAQLALQIFDGLRSTHGLGARERELCEYVAHLADVGESIAFAGHEHLAFHLTRGGGLRGFTSAEIDILALAARYHRKGQPKPRHHHFADLDTVARQVVKVLAGVVRMADALDRGRTAAVERVSVDVGRRRVDLLVHGRDVSLELWAARRQTQLLARALDRELVVSER